MDNSILLFSAFVLYIIGMIFALTFDRFYMVFVALLWIVPIITLEHDILKLFCVIMFILHIIIPLSKKGENDFE